MCVFLGLIEFMPSLFRKGQDAMASKDHALLARGILTLCLCILGIACRNLPEVLSVSHESACSPSVVSLQNGQQDVDHCVEI